MVVLQQVGVLDCVKPNQPGKQSGSMRVMMMVQAGQVSVHKLDEFYHSFFGNPLRISQRYPGVV